ncbi:DUF6371 domain-containing protein [Cytophagaceae bacterium DM2B3-1]|uniref:DUF6371 domain-containing protein n=1 Tax=Xanthocytophaga flava TaxID=3048013 RepID=A0ABT7CFF5_9BACT|nr:DUF6371 domain-containing protein [Xanthocytophaga flavus]MDJ1492476.1 DUF6371 domain-containing protein [Xanthocytophaga flavus]
MQNYRYQLKPYRTPADRLTCPSCGVKRALAPYWDNQTGEILNPQVGKCNRLDTCGYHYPPRAYFQDNPDLATTPPTRQSLPEKPHSIHKQKIYLPEEVIYPALKSRFRSKNTFWQYLSAKYGAATAHEVFDRYRLGTSNAYKGGSTIFPLYDGIGYASAQIIKVHPATCKTIRFAHGRATTWLHSVLAQQSETTEPWLTTYIEQADKYPHPFGLHLLTSQPHQTVCIVESAKTAVVCSIEYPEFCWMAIGALSWLNAQRLAPLQDSNLVLIPDGGAGTKDWTTKATLLQRQGFSIQVADLNLPTGDDLADLSFAVTDTVTPIPVQPVSEPVETPIMPAYSEENNSSVPPICDERKLAFVTQHAEMIAFTADLLGVDLQTAVIREM